MVIIIIKKKKDNINKRWKRKKERLYFTTELI